MSDAPESESFRFRPEEHIRRTKDFRRVYDHRRSVSDHWLVVYGLENGLPHSRLGLSVSKKFGNAVHRNLLRRLYREAFRLTRNYLPVGIDLVLIPRRPDEPTLAVLMQSLNKLVISVAKKLANDKKPEPPT